MKIYVLVSLVLVGVVAISAAPSESRYPKVELFEDIAEVSEERATRQRRVTCDLLSAGGFVGDTACAANCLSMGKAGGHCNGSGVCVCRQDSIKDLFNKRFG
ncbi:defensin-like [Vespa mandarinia]|uniref:defensin-like n=1 Tax=Vespa mandarinia TaxID=7446 RepID=UPI00160AC7BF|nr:defensin-like [Vespa mandarinia]